MPSVFLSYSSQQLPFAQKLGAELKSKGIEAWRDKTQLHVGERWPKALGDAIADSDALVLLWSADANQSDFVELEWNIAVAMQKPVMPCLLDDTSLPPTLTPSHRISGDNIQQAAEQIISALKGLPPSTPIKQQEKLLESLSTVQAVEPQQVLNQIKTIINQPNWSVEGNVYQVHGDMHLNTVAEKQEKSPKTKIEKWKYVTGLVVSILTALTLFLGLSTQLGELMPGLFGKQQTVLLSLGGYIFDARTHDPLPDVQVTITGANLSKTMWTKNRGHFEFQASIPSGTKVTLEATRPGYVRVWEENIEFGDSKIKFVMERVDP